MRREKRLALGLLTICLIVQAAMAQQTMPNPVDQACLDAASVEYIQCMKTAISEPQKQSCQKTMDEKKKACPRKKKD